MSLIFLNGRFVERGEARVSAFDAGLQHGVGLFETMRASLSGGEAVVHGLEAHMRRLAESARILGLSDSLRVGALGDAVVAAVEKAGIVRARVRLTVTGGDLNLLSRARERAEGSGGGSAVDTGRSPVPPGDAQDPTVLIDVQPATAYPEEMFERGVGVAIADAKANPFNSFEGHKTLDYWWRLRALQEAAMKRTSEALVFTVTNHLGGGCVSNAFVVKDGMLLTPIARGEEDEVAAADVGRGAVLPSPVLPGVTRAEIVAMAEGAGLRVERRMLSVSDVLGADEVFLTNSSWGVLPVVRVEAATIGDGRPGDVTRMLRGKWSEGA